MYRVHAPSASIQRSVRTSAAATVSSTPAAAAAAAAFHAAALSAASSTQLGGGLGVRRAAGQDAGAPSGGRSFAAAAPPSSNAAVPKLAPRLTAASRSLQPSIVPSGPVPSSYPLSEHTSAKALRFLRPPEMILRDIEAGALTDSSPGRSVTVSALKHQFNEALRNARPIAELTAVFRVWVSVMSQPPLAVVTAQRAAAQALAAGEPAPPVPAWKPQPPDLSYIHLYIEARVRKGHKLTAVLVDLTPLVGCFTEETLVQCMLLCAKQRSPEETVATLRFLNTYMTQRIPFTLALMNQFIENFSLQNDISGAAILYDELANYSLLPDRTTYRSMYLGFARMKEIEACFSVLGHMQTRGLAIEIGMIEEIIEVTIRYHNAEAGLLTLQRIPSFAASQPPVGTGVAGVDAPKPLVASNRCYELLIRAYLQRHELDTVMQLYYELRNAGLVLHSLPDFNQLLKMVAEKISFTDALNIMADRIQAYEKQQAAIVGAATTATPTADAAAVDPAAATALAVVPAAASPVTDPIPLPDISSFNILLHIAGLIDRKPEHIQLIVSELQRIGVAMNTQTFNELIQAYSALGEIKGMYYIYNEFKDSALKQKLEWGERRRAADMSAGGSIFGNSGSSSSIFSSPSKTTAEEYASLASFCPDVNTFNLMLEQIEPQRYFADLHVEAAGSAAVISAKYPSLSESEAAAMQQVESLLADMRSFELMPNASTFKHVLRIMSSVGSSSEAADATAVAPLDQDDEDDDSKSPHVVRFFSMLMDMVVAHQKAQSLIGGGSEATQAAASTVSPISAPVFSPFGSPLPSPDGSAPVPAAASFEKSWESFLSFLYNSSRTLRDQARNFSYILMCLRRLRKDSIHIPKQVVKTLLEDHLGYKKEEGAAPVTRELDRSKPMAVAEMEMRQDAALSAAATSAPRSSATDVNLLQSIQLVREFANPIEFDLISIILDAAHMRETGVSALVRPQADQAPVPTVPTPLLRMLVHNAQRVLVWDLPMDNSQLSISDVTLLQTALSSVTASSTSSSFVFGSTSRKQQSKTLSPTDRASIHWHIYQSCRSLRQYELAMETVTDMVRFHAHHTATTAASAPGAAGSGSAGADSSAPSLYVASGGKLIMFQDLLQDLRKCAAVRTPRGDWDWSLLHLLFQTASKSWGLTIPLHAYHSLMSDALAHSSAPLAYFAFSTAVRHWDALRAINPAAPTSGPNSIAPDLRLTNDMLHMLTRSAEKVYSAQRLAASAAAGAPAVPSSPGLDSPAAIEAAQNEVLSQFELVFATTSSLQLILAPTLLQHLAALAQKFQSDRLALSFLAYVSRMRGPANDLFYIPVISLCSQYGHHALGMHLYSALKVAKPADMTLEAFAALLRLQAHAPTPAQNAMWAIWAEMKTKMLKRAVSPAGGPLMYQFARVQQAAASGTASTEAPVTMGLIRDLLVACRSHPPALQLSQDLPQIEELVQAFATCAPSSSGGNKKLPRPAPTYLIGNLASLAVVFTQGQVATLTEEINAARAKATQQVAAVEAERQSTVEQAEAGRTVGERILSGITPVAVGAPVPIAVAPQPDVVQIAVRNLAGSASADPAPPKTNAPQQPLSLGDRLLRNVVLAQIEPTSSKTVGAVASAAPTSTPTAPAVPLATPVAAEPKPASAAVAATAPVAAAPKSKATVRPVTVAPAANMTVPVVPASAPTVPAAPAAPAVAAVAPAAPEVAAAFVSASPVSPTTSAAVAAPAAAAAAAAAAATSAFPPLPPKAAAVSGRPSKSFPPVASAAPAARASVTPAVAAASHVPVLLDSFLHWSELSKDLSLLSAEEKLKRLGQPETVRHVRNLVYNGQLVAGLQQLAALSPRPVAAELTSTQRSLLGVKNRDQMIHVLFEYCAAGRNIHVFTAIAQQLQAANLLPKAASFLQLSQNVLLMWKNLQKQRAQAGETTPKEGSNEAEVEAEERRTNLAPSDRWESSTERDGGHAEGASTSAAAALRSEESVRFLRVTLQWLCIACKQPVEVWQSGLQIETSQLSAGKETFTAEAKSSAPLTLTSSTVRIGFNAVELRKRLEHWDTRGVTPSIDRILNVYAFKTLCNFAVRGQYAKVLPFLRSLDANFDESSLSLNLGTIMRSALQWLVHHHYHAQASELWTAMMIVYLPRLKKRMRDTSGEVEAVDMRRVAQQKRAHKHHADATIVAANATAAAVETPEQVAAATQAFQTVQSLCHELLHLYVLEHDDDTMLFRVYATMRSLDIAPSRSVLVLVPPALASTLPPAHQLLYVLVSRVLNMHGHVKIDYLVKLFGELLKVPMLAPPPFRMPDANRAPMKANAPGGAVKKEAAATTTAAAAESSEWPIVPRFLERIAARFVSEYVVPSWPQRLSKPEFAEMIKKLILYLDSSDAMSLNSGTADRVQQSRRDRLWSLFLELQTKGVVFSVPLLHHLAQSLATKDALFSKEVSPGVTVATAKPLASVPIPTLVQQIWKLLLHHGHVDRLTLSYLFLALFRHFRANQTKRGLVPRTIRNVDFYRHVLYGNTYTPPTGPGGDALTLAAEAGLMAAKEPSLGELAASGFAPGVAMAYLGLDKLESPLPNQVHLLFTQVQRDWIKLMAAERKELQKEGEAQGLSPEDALAAALAVEAEAGPDATDLPVDVHAYNLVVQSFLLFHASSAVPIRWAALAHVRALMAERSLLLNPTSTLYLLDALIEAGQFEEARALLPPEDPALEAANAGGKRRRLMGLTQPTQEQQTEIVKMAQKAAEASASKPAVTAAATATAPAMPEAAASDAPAPGFMRRLLNWFRGPSESTPSPPAALPAAVAAAPAAPSVSVPTAPAAAPVVPPVQLSPSMFSAVVTKPQQPKQPQIAKNATVASTPAAAPSIPAAAAAAAAGAAAPAKSAPAARGRPAVAPAVPAKKPAGVRPPQFGSVLMPRPEGRKKGGGYNAHATSTETAAPLTLAPAKPLPKQSK